jgi:hypothetical protein
VRFEQIRAAGEPRPIPLGSQGVAEAPSDADFAAAAVWRIHLPEFEPDADLRISIDYAGDVARLMAGGKLLTDNFYNGSRFEVGLGRYAGRMQGEELTLQILPLRADAPIYLPDDADRGGAVVRGIDLVEELEVAFTSSPEPAPVKHRLADRRNGAG